MAAAVKKSSASALGSEAGVVIAAQATPPSEAIASPVSVPLVSPAPFVPLITFEQWFATLKRKPHHIHGMRVFAPTCGHLSASAWAERFAAY